MKQTPSTNGLSRSDLPINARLLAKGENASTLIPFYSENIRQTHKGTGYLKENCSEPVSVPYPHHHHPHHFTSLLFSLVEHTLFFFIFTISNAFCFTYYSRRQPPFNPYFWQNRNLSNDIQDIQLAELSNMQNPFNFNSLRRNVPRISQNYGVVPDAIFLQNYERQFQNELELRHHFNSLLNIYPFERKELNTEWCCYEDSSELWYSREDHDRWSTQQQQHNTQQHQQQQHINDGSWVTFNNV